MLSLLTRLWLLSKVSFQFVTSLVLHHDDKTLGRDVYISRWWERRVQALPKKQKEKKKRGEVMCQIPPFPSLFTGFDMSTTTTTTTYSFLSLSLLGGFSFFNRNWLSLFVFRLFASLVDLYCRSRPRNEIQKTFSFHCFGYFWGPTAVSLRKEKQNNQRNEGQSVLCSLAKSVSFVWFAHPRADPMTPVKRTHRRIIRRKTSPAPAKQRLDHTLKGPLKIITE